MACNIIRLFYTRTKRNGSSIAILAEDMQNVYCTDNCQDEQLRMCYIQQFICVFIWHGVYVCVYAQYQSSKLCEKNAIHLY